MSISDLSKPLDVNQIDFRVQSISANGWCTILAYKDARVDMNRLNGVIGAGYWQKKFEEINGRLYCSVGIYNKDIKEWAWVQDVGTESNTEKEKGQASDAFKRACFNLGIGIELYGYPHIFLQLNDKEFSTFEQGGKTKGRQTWDLKLKEWKWLSQFNNKNEITFLAGKDQNDKRRFTWGEYRGEDK